MQPRRISQTAHLVLALALPLACTLDPDPSDDRQFVPQQPDGTPNVDEDDDDDGSSAGESDGGDDDAPCGDDDPPPDDGVCSEEEPCAGQAGVGRYYIDRCGVLGGSVIGASIACQDALDTCLLNESDSDMPVFCEWNDIVIHRTSEASEICDAEYGMAGVCEAAPCSDPCAGHEDMLGFTVPYVGCDETPDWDPSPAFGEPQTCADALAACTELAAELAGESLVCVWGGEVLVWHEAAPGECAAFGPAPVSCEAEA